MEYKPRYSQPFTLEEARQLAIPIIAEEISRLQNSLAHLQRTQKELKDALTTSPGDVDLTEAFEENEIVIGSQSERIRMLQIVLAEKGIPMSAHYDVASTREPPRSVSHVSENASNLQANTQGSSVVETQSLLSSSDGDGIFL